MARSTSFIIGLLAVAAGVLAYALPPNAYSFARFLVGTIFTDAMLIGQAGDGREAALLAHVKSTATRNDPQSVLDAIDKFAWSGTWLMNVGDVKGKYLDEEIVKHQPKTALEIGSYVGYSAVRIASQLPPGGKLYSVDFSTENVKIAREVVEYAGLSERVEFIVGVLSNVTKVRCQSTRPFALGLELKCTAIHLNILLTVHLQEGFFPV